MSSSPFQLQSVDSPADTGVLQEILQSESLEILKGPPGLDFRPLPVTVCEQAQAADIPGCISRDPEGPYIWLQPHCSHSPQEVLLATGTIGRHSHLHSQHPQRASFWFQDPPSHNPQTVLLHRDQAGIEFFAGRPLSRYSGFGLNFISLLK